jgi:putative ABC transport system substrate-binding protein
MRRRQFIAGLGGAAAWPLVARAQQGAQVYRIGVLMPSDSPVTQARYSAFRKALVALGWLENWSDWRQTSSFLFPPDCPRCGG